MAQKRRAGVTRQRVIHTTRWLATNVNAGALAAGSVAVGPVLAAGSPAETILRTRGEGSVFVDTTEEPGGRSLISMGLVLVPEGQSTTVIWDPFNDDNAPWMWFKEVMVAYEEMVTDVIDVPSTTGARFEIDVKAMRKANEDEELQFVAVNTTLATAMAVNINVALRFLLGH